MKQFWKRGAALVLCAVMLVSSLPKAYAAAEPDFQAILSAGEEGQNTIYPVTEPSFSLNSVGRFAGDYAIYQDYYGNSGILDCRGNVVFAPRAEIVPNTLIDKNLFVSKDGYLYDFQGNKLYDKTVSTWGGEIGILRDQVTNQAYGVWIGSTSIMEGSFIQFYTVACSFQGQEEIGAVSQPRNGIVSVKVDGKYGLKKLFGEEILPLEYDLLVFLTDDTLFFSKDGVNGLLAADGTVKETFDYDNVYVERVNGAEEFELVVKKDGKTGVLSPNGAVLIPLEYDSIRPCDLDNFRYIGELNGTEYYISLDDSLRFCGTSNFPLDCWVLSKHVILLQDENAYGILVNENNERLIPECLSGTYVARIGSNWAMPILETNTTRLYNGQMQLVAELEGHFNKATSKALVFERNDSNGVPSVVFYGSNGELLHSYENTSLSYLNVSDCIVVLRQNGKYAFADAVGNMKTDFCYSYVYEISSGWDGLRYPFCLANQDGGDHYQIIDGRTGSSVLPADSFVTAQAYVLPEGNCFAYFRDGKTGFAKLADRNEPFRDVKESDWYGDPVRFCFNAGLMGGTGNGYFSPKSDMTRAMLVQVLYSISGEKTESYGFKDVKAGKWYADAVNWAAKNEIVSGTGNGKFSPDLPITREQLVAILYRYASLYGNCQGNESVLDGYTDAGKISSYARQAFAWAIENNMVTGTSATTLSPRNTATRAQIATIMRQFVILNSHKNL